MSSKLILLVEDDNNLRQSFALILQRAGFSVTATECASKAIDLIQSGNYQLVISDMHMSTTRDVLLPKILYMYPQLTLVLLTDHSMLEVEKEDKSPCTHYLTKPIAPERLLDYVRTITTMEN